jgi:AraC family transcriptional regulator, arabinose operon regulatory protein
MQQSRFVTPELAVVYLERGVCSFRQNARSPWLELSAGQAFKRFPGVAHDVRFEAGSVAWFAAVPAEAMQFLRVLGLPNLDQPTLTLGWHSSLAERFARLQRVLSRATPRVTARIAADLLSLVVEIHLLSSEFDAQGRALEKAASMLTRSEPHVSQVAEVCGFRYSTFRLAFKRRFGVSPVGFRVNAKVERAATLLLETGRPIGEIALELGYLDVYAFSAQFKRVTGTSPSRFRRLGG